MKQIQLIIILVCAGVVSALAWKEPAVGRTDQIQFRVNCAPGQSSVDLDVNNVRARLSQSGSVFYNGDDGRYIVPKVDPSTGEEEVSAIFAGAIWIGGFQNQNFRVAAVQYGLNAGDTDWFPGPLDAAGEIGQDTCQAWDEHFVVAGTDISTFRRVFEEKEGVITEADVPSSILGWPAKGNPYFRQENGFSLPRNNEPLAGFNDANLDGIYDPLDGDFPIIEIRDCDITDPPVPDEMIFWIFNDNGNAHSESNGDPIRMEVQVQAFAFSTNDQINDMTFYRYKMINRAPSNIDSMYFANWADVDLGCSDDDFIGCDTTESLAIIYNNDAVDGINGCDCPVGGGNTPTYCRNVPMLGIDYFRGPLTPTTSVIDTVLSLSAIQENASDIWRASNCEEIMGSDTTLTCDLEYEIELGMSSFVYHVREGLDPLQRDPSIASEYYAYLSGSWRDGRTPITSGGTGLNAGSTDFTRYVFPSAPNDMSDGAWSMQTANIEDIDPRIIQASGPFVLEPGKINELIVGVVFVPDIPDYPAPSLQPLLEADVAAQGLFDNCFNLLDGPEAPDVSIIELDQELVLTISNPECSNNFLEQYTERDIFAPADPTNPEATDYQFEGYLIYQLVNGSIGVSELGDTEKARLLAQVDITNGVSSIYNWSTVNHPDPSQPAVFVPELQVQGSDAGTRHSFNVEQDLFAAGEGNQLVNHKQYYYIALSYGYNNYEDFDFITGTGQKSAYLTGRQSSCRRAIETYIGIPRPSIADDLNADYGDGAVITRIEGQGAGGNFLRIEPSQVESILNGTNDGRITYLPGSGPVEISVFNPLVVQDGTYTLKILDSDLTDDVLDSNGGWELYQNNQLIRVSDYPLDRFNEQLISELGFSVALGQTNDAGDRVIVNGDPVDKSGDDNGLIGVEVEYTTQNDAQWFQSYRDNYFPAGLPGLSTLWNYIRTDVDEVDMDLDMDNTSYSNFGNGLFYPYFICSADPTADYTCVVRQKDGGSIRNKAPIEQLNNVNVVMTSDKSLWSRCMVIETASSFYRGNDFGITPDEAQFTVSSNPSVGKDDNDGDGLPDPDGSAENGFSWFPGYAYDVETGQRLNIFFGENSMFDAAKYEAASLNVDEQFFTGDDLMLNPVTADLIPFEDGFRDPILVVSGGGHMIYVSNTEYDSCQVLHEFLSSTSGARQRNAAQMIKWVSFLKTSRPFLPLGASGENGLIPEDVIVRLRVDNQYGYAEQDAGECFGYPTYEFELNGFEKTAKTFAEDATVLDEILAVPNPYYGFSSYETGILDNRIKITNLPDQATITIYSLDGKFIRQYDRNEEPRRIEDPTSPILSEQVVPDLDWDLENYAGIPVASGVYIIHINAPGIGEKVIKWFGIQREFDPSGL